MIIRGLLPGNMISGLEPAREQNRDSEFVDCPKCDGRMHKTAKLCKDCHVKQNGTFDPIDTAGRRERQERWDMALAAGWAFKELYSGKFDPDDPKKDKLPTRTEIVKRMIENWYKGGTSE